MSPRADAELVMANDRAAWRRWLERHHERSTGVWLAIAKKGSEGKVVPYEDAVLEALCFGWIDATANAVDDDRYQLWMAPRKAGSGWSAVNKKRLERLLAEGAMAPAGLAAVERAKVDGSWSKLDASHAVRVPRDLATALKAYPDAKRNFDAFPPSARRAILEWIGQAKRAETRAKRVEETSRLAERNERANQWSPKR